LVRWTLVWYFRGIFSTTIACKVSRCSTIITISGSLSRFSTLCSRFCLHNSYGLSKLLVAKREII
jgi:hypothetical protein